MPKTTVIPAGSQVLMCQHMDADNVPSHWYKFEEIGTAAICAKCDDAFQETGLLPARMMLCVLNVDRFPRLPSIQ